MAYDPAARLLLLFGGSWDKGQSSGGVLSGSWAWNGKDWTQLKAVRLPTWMPGAPIAYDPVARRVTVLAPRPRCPCSQPPGAFHDSTGSGRVGRWLWTGRSWSFHVQRDERWLWPDGYSRKRRSEITESEIVRIYPYRADVPDDLGQAVRERRREHRHLGRLRVLPPRAALPADQAA
jgi:hypothetical protein